jgi:hypothetical protein
MGMFDTIFCKANLPLNDELKGLNLKWDEVDFQTKDLDNSLATYSILEDGSLIEHVSKYEYIPFSEEEKKSKDNKSWSVWKAVNLIEKYDKVINHHGAINFYTSLQYTEEKDIWVEFTAFFVYGNLDKIELFDVHQTESSSLCNKRIEESIRNEQKKFKYKLKRRLNRIIGWRWTWSKIANIIRKIINFLYKVEYFIRFKIC